jgi:uncharacterized membrane protein
MTSLFYAFSLLSLLLAGEVSGFFYAWVCSTMRGLDTVDPMDAITVMQSINASVHNAVFATACFGTLIVLGTATSTVAARSAAREH